MIRRPPLQVHSPVEFPEELSISGGLLGEGSPLAGGGGAGEEVGEEAGEQAGEQAAGTYLLTAVLMHTGPSASSGHYTARIRDPYGDGQRGDGPRSAGRWWSCNDECVSEEGWGEPSGAARQSGVTLLRRSAAGGGRLFASKTAYMLQYTRRSELDEARAAGPPQAPQAVLSALREANAALRARARQYDDDVAAVEAKVRSRDEYLAALSPLLQAASPAARSLPDARWVPASWLRSSLALLREAEVGPVPNGEIRCEHGKADPAKLGEMRLVSPAAWRRMVRRCGSGAGHADCG